MLENCSWHWTLILPRDNIEGITSAELYYTLMNTYADYIEYIRVGLGFALFAESTVDKGKS